MSRAIPRFAFRARARSSSTPPHVGPFLRLVSRRSYSLLTRCGLVMSAHTSSHTADCDTFPSVGHHPSTDSAGEDLSPLFGGFFGTMQPSDFPRAYMPDARLPFSGRPDAPPVSGTRGISRSPRKEFPRICQDRALQRCALATCGSGQRALTSRIVGIRLFDMGLRLRGVRARLAITPHSVWPSATHTASAPRM